MTETVTIGGREFRIGATYAARPERYRGGPRSKGLTLTYYNPETGRVRTIGCNGHARWFHRTTWPEWAGEEVQP